MERIKENICQTEDLKTKVNYLWANDERAKEYNQPRKPDEPIICEYCGKTVYAKGLISFTRNIIWFKPQCSCEKAVKYREELERQKKQKERKEAEEEARRKQQAKIEKLFKTSKLGERFRTRTFENFQVNSKNEKAYNTAKRFVQNFDTVKEKGLGMMFIGNYGTGKTHLACSIAIDLINKGIPVIYGSSISLLGKIKESYESNNTNEWQVLDLYANVDLLIIDDLGKERPSEWVLEKLYYIINQRYENLKPIIITSNYNANSELINRLSTNKGNLSTAEAIISRLNEMCTGVFVEGEDYRKR